MSGVGGSKKVENNMRNRVTSRYGRDTFLCGYSVPKGWVVARADAREQPLAYAPHTTPGSHPPITGWSIPWLAGADELASLTPAGVTQRRWADELAHDELPAAAAGPRPPTGPPTLATARAAAEGRG